MIAADTSTSRWVGLCPGDRVRVVLMNSAVSVEKSRSAVIPGSYGRAAGMVLRIGDGSARGARPRARSRHHRPVQRTVRIAAALGAATVVGLGVWVTGGVLTDDAVAAKAATAGWFGLALVAAALVARRWRPLAAPVLTATGLAVALVGGVLLWTSTVDKVVVEDVVEAGPAPAGPAPAGPPTDAAARPGATRSGAPDPAAPDPAAADPAAAGPAAAGPAAGPTTSPATGAAGELARPTGPAGPVLLARGKFHSGEHATSGTAALLRRPDGSTVITLTDLDTSPGPDLRVQLVPGQDGGTARAVDAGALRGNRGTQQYTVPPGTDLDRVGAVVIWCRAFSVAFGTAPLAAA